MKLSPKLTPLAAIAGAFASLTCCLPFGFLAALGSASAAALLAPLRPWLLGLSVALLAMGFVQLYVGPRACARRTPWNTVLLWVTAAAFVALLLLPLSTSGGFGPRHTPPGQPPLAALTPNTLGEFQRVFNDSSSSTRVVVLLSPT